jgi:hypothetical protein
MMSFILQHKSGRLLLFLAVFFVLIILAIVTGNNSSVSRSVLAQDSILCTGNSTIPQYIVEAGKTSTYTLALCTKPAEPVTVTVKPESGYETQFTIKPVSLTLHFNEANWNHPSIVSLVPVNDNTVEERLSIVTIEHMTESKDLAFHFPNTSVKTIEVQVNDNDGKIWMPLAYRIIPPTPTPTRTPIPTPIPTSTPIPQWKQLSPNPQTADVIAISTNGLFAGGRASNNVDNGIYKNSDCGSLNRIESNIQVYDFAFQGSIGLAATNGSKVYFSSDGGNSWRQTSSNMDRFAFAVTQSTGSLFYAGTDDGLYESNDNGQSWRKLNGGPRLVNKLVYDASKNSIWLLTYGNGVWRYDLGLGQFTEHNRGLDNVNQERRVWDLVIHPSGVIYIATTNGIYKGNGTDNWSATLLENSVALSLELVNNAVLYAGTNGNGTWEYNLQTSVLTQLSLDSSLIVSDLLYDSSLCNALLAATTNGIWIYR